MLNNSYITDEPICKLSNFNKTQLLHSTSEFSKLNRYKPDTLCSLYIIVYTKLTYIYINVIIICGHSPSKLMVFERRAVSPVCGIICFMFV